MHAAEHARPTRRRRHADPRRLPQAGRRARREAACRASAIRRCDAFNALQPAMQDDINVHRFVFAHRTYGLVGLARQGVRLHACCGSACGSASITSRISIEHKQPESPIRALVPKLLDQYKLAGKTLGKRDPGDAAVDELASAIYNGPPDKSAEAVAAALADGIDPEVVGEAISLASNLLRAAAGAGQVADARRFGRRPFVRRHQRLAQHGPHRRAAARRSPA